jgi:hypothetical protein
MRNSILRTNLGFVILGLSLVSCSAHVLGPGIHGEVGVAVAPSSIAGNGPDHAGPTLPVSGGANALGVTVPTSTAVVGRIETGLEGNAPATAGNFAKALTQVRSNLPKVTNVADAAGFDQVELLAYAACSDLTTGSPAMMQSKYNVQVASTIAANQAALVAAGIKMLDQHTAGLASQGPAAAQISTIFTNLVQAQAGVTSNTSKIAFMAVCIAANTAGSAMLGM